MMQKAAVALLLLAVTLVSCASQNRGDPSAFDRAPLFGMIYDEDNQPCPGVNLGVDGKDSDQETGLVSDIRGRFVVPDLQRGKHVVIARKEGFEDLSVEVLFLNKTDVLFLRMVSFGQLLTSAEKALGERKWAEADAFLTRAEKLDAGDGVLLYLRAVRAYKIGMWQEAVVFLNIVLDKGIKEPAVYLFLADLYERKLAEPQKAIESLQEYLSRIADEEAQKRLDGLKGQAKK
ncbi:MAG: carboxypeptidase regulatory-like domain-containing protein [Spirochaetia bacterium]